MSKEKICYGCMRGMKASEVRCVQCGFNISQYLSEKNVNTLNPGEVLHGRYLVGKVLGIGGFGITYIGFDQVLQIRIAIKEYFPSEYAARNTAQTSQYFNEVRATQSKEFFSSGLQRFLSEARILARFNKMNGIVSVTDFFHENGTGYMIMEYLPGQSLKEMVLSRDGIFTEDEIKEQMLPVLDALEVIHEEGLIHRDISPDNLIMNRSGKLTLIDFGAARDISQSGRSLTVVLKHGYAPIEQYTTSGKQGPWTDIYALCATMFFMMTHAVPQTSTDRALEDKQLSLQELGMPVSYEFSKAIQKGLSVHADFRFTSIGELKQALYHEKESVKKYDDVFLQTSSSEDSFLNKNEQQKKGRKKYAALAISFVCLLFFGASVFFAWENIAGNSPNDTKISDSFEEEMTELSGTYVTYKSVNINYLSIYESPGDAKKSGKVPEGKCVQVLGNKIYENAIWYKIEYCGKEGWIEEDNIRYLSDGDEYFHIDEDISKNIIFVNMEQIKVHTEPKTKSPYAGTGIPYGTEFEVTALDNGWGQIQYKGKTCWIDMNVVSHYATPYWQVEICNGTSDSINLRKKADGNSKSLAKIPVGEVLKVNQFKNGWGKVNYGGKTGWIKLHYATSCSPEGLSFSEDLGD